MADPINAMQAVQAYANTAKGAEAPGMDAPKGPSFGEFMRDAALKSIDTMRAGETASARAVAGEANLPEVVQAVTAAELTLQTVVSIRDRLVSAYQEVMRMPI